MPENIVLLPFALGILSIFLENALSTEVEAERKSKHKDCRKVKFRIEKYEILMHYRFQGERDDAKAGSAKRQREPGQRSSSRTRTRRAGYTI